MSKERIYTAGERIGPYEVTRVLATGGMGVVYEARPDPEQRADLAGHGVERVAVKVARLEALPEDRMEKKHLIERLDREFHTLSQLTRLDHPNVVRVYDYGWSEGAPYYAMELVEGVALTDALAERPRLGQILHSFAELCGAVAFLHYGGICHRDLKPSNVLLRCDGGAPVLIDFGLCLPPSGRPLTGPGELLGTPAYLSPEYAAHWLDVKRERAYLAAPTDDVWALGVMLYEVLTGGLPWRTPIDLREALLREIKKGKPVHPCRVNKLVPKPLGDVTMKLLTKNYRKRPQNAAEALLLLGAAAEGTDVLSRVPERRRRYRDITPGQLPTEKVSPRRNRGHLGLVPVVGLCVLAVAAGYVMHGVRGDSSADAGTDDAAQAASNPGETSELPDPVTPSHPREATLPGGTVGPEEGYGIAKGKPFPQRPFRAQLLAPCEKPYVEIIGACWKEHRMVLRDGRTAPCGPDTYERQGKCYLPVGDEMPNSIELDGGTPP